MTVGSLDKPEFEDIRMKKLFLVLIMGAVMTGMIACGGGNDQNSNGNSSTPPPPGNMAGSWDFTATSASFSGFMVAVEAILAQDNSGNLSATGSAAADGPSGNVTVVTLVGSSLADTTNGAVDYLGSVCSGNDNGARKLAGTINSSNQVAITFNDGGSETITITGTLSASAAPTFSGTFKVSAPGCSNDGVTGTVTGVTASSVAGSYSGTPFNDDTDNIAFTLTAGGNNSFSGGGTDAQNGPFTVSGNSVGNASAITITDGSGTNTAFFGYYDPQLGSKGSVLVTAFLGADATSCPNGATIAGGSCLYGIFARQ
jgi:hypothetical protein